MSETSRCRLRLKKYCVGYGADVGFGGDPIVPGAITIDMPVPYTNVGSSPLNLGGDARSLYWFSDNSLNYVYSSHLLEDFEPNETKDVILEWLRVLTVDGNLILYLPDERKYRKHCDMTGASYNYSHKVSDFNLDYIKRLIQGISNIAIVHENAACEDYSFEIVIKKIGKTEKSKFSKVMLENEISDTKLINNTILKKLLKLVLRRP